MSRMITAVSITVAVERIGRASTLPDSISTWFWLMSKLAAVVAKPAIESTAIIPSRRDGQGMGCKSQLGPPCSALVCWQVWHERTYWAMATSAHCA